MGYGIPEYGYPHDKVIIYHVWLIPIWVMASQIIFCRKTMMHSRMIPGLSSFRLEGEGTCSERECRFETSHTFASRLWFWPNLFLRNCSKMVSVQFRVSLVIEPVLNM